MTTLRRVAAFVLTTTAVLVLLGGYFAYRASTPVTVASTEIELPADQENLIASIKVIAPQLAVDKVRTIALLRNSCPDLTLSEQEIKNHFIERFSDGDFVMSPAHAIIISVKLRRSGLCTAG